MVSNVELLLLSNVRNSCLLMTDLTEMQTPARMLLSVSRVSPLTPVCTEPSSASRAG